MWSAPSYKRYVCKHLGSSSFCQTLEDVRCSGWHQTFAVLDALDAFEEACYPPPKLKIAKALETCSTKLTNHTVAANPTLSPKLGASEPHELAADGQDQIAPTVPPELIGRRGNADTGRFRSRNVRLLVAFLALETFIASVVSPQLELLFHCSSMSGPYFR
jgi:hypothetical protein